MDGDTKPGAIDKYGAWVRRLYFNTTASYTSSVLRAALKHAAWNIVLGGIARQTKRCEAKRPSGAAL